MEKYTVLMSVYFKELPNRLEESINSMLEQSISPDEILLLEDGPLTKELYETIEKYKNNKIIKVVSFEKNRGLGPVLADGVVLARNKLVARMDTDDISEKDRCEKQLKIFEKNPELAIVGGGVREFLNDDITDVVSKRNMPETYEEIYKYAHTRSPFAHPTVMFNKEKIIEAGNYRKCDLFEDYDLWVRILQKEFKCYNIQEKLVNMRVSKEFYARRGGWSYLKKIIKFKYDFYKNKKFYSLKDFIVSTSAHTVVCLLPGKLRYKVYIKLLRKEKRKWE